MSCAEGDQLCLHFPVGGEQEMARENQEREKRTVGEEKIQKKERKVIREKSIHMIQNVKLQSDIHFITISRHLSDQKSI